MKKIHRVEKRTKGQILEHYKIEKELAGKLYRASKGEREILYRKLYDELYTRVPHHPQLTRKSNTNLGIKQIQSQIKLLKKYFFFLFYFMELGPGDCALSFELCKYFKKVYAIDVSKKITNNSQGPINFELILSYIAHDYHIYLLRFLFHK